MTAFLPRILRRATARLPRRWRALARSRRGVAAVEFAMVLPFLLTLYFGMAEVSTGVSVDRKLTLLSRSLADLAGRATDMTDAELEATFGAASAVMHPYDGSTVKMVISHIKVYNESGSLVGRVCWSETVRGTALARNTVVNPVPDGFRTAGMTYVQASAQMTYTPTIGYVVTGSLQLSEDTPWPVRNVSEIPRSGTNRCP
ncbi:MAG TPA: TadE/TadG family type IV pilus assembly protein [Salinarimonas sp.]|nr:TadE/TadG family type IV pilus assembly protein [Salinarimonas sp.]